MGTIENLGNHLGNTGVFLEGIDEVVGDGMESCEQGPTTRLANA